MTPLDAAITALEFQNDTLGKARNDFLLKSAERKHFEATLIQKAPGSSQKERETNAQADPAWLTFAKELARLEAVYEFQRLKFGILEKHWHNAFLEAKIDQNLIKKQI